MRKKSSLARREFLRAAGMCAAGAGAGILSPSAAPAFAQSGAGGGANGSKMPRMFSGCCAYSYRKQFLANQITMEDFIRKAVELRVDGVDMTVYFLRSKDPAYLDGLRHLAYKNAVPFSGAACGSSLVQGDAEKRAAAVTDAKGWLDVTDRLGASHLRVFAGKLPPGATLQQATDWTVESLKQICDYAGQKGIMVGLEDHSGVSQSAEVCLEIMRRVDSPYAGINLDITHFIPTPTQDAYAQIAACVPYATNTHIRDRFDDGSPIDLDRVWKLFADAGFRGYMSLEYEPGPNEQDAPENGIPRMAGVIRGLCAKYSSTGA